MTSVRFPGCAVLCLAGLSGVLAAPQQADYDSSPINYSKSRPAESIARLEGRMSAGEAKLVYEPAQGYLKSVLRELGIPASSQSLVFSKTSFQRQWINPRSPRALYFNDEVYVGFVQGAEVLEVASQDPQLGTVFYTLAQDPSRPARFLRQTDNCLQCHDSASLTLGVPGVTIRSVFPAGDGLPRFNLGGYRTTYRSPLEERWGGWYVSGEHGLQRHLGNITFPEDPSPELARLRDKGANLTELSKWVDIEPYLTDSSDIVALMVLEYQTTAHNLITRANHETRLAILQSDEMNRAMGLPLRPLREGSQRRIDYACGSLVEALLYSGETVLAAPIKGNSSFVSEFEKLGPLDRQGRSLRQFDLTHRMFKYPLSYLIYSRTFAGLPDEAKEVVARHLGKVISGRDKKKEFAHLSPEDRQAIREIVDDTLPSLAACWK